MLAGLLLTDAMAIAQAPAAAAPTGNSGNGKLLFSRNGCYQCHGWGGQGGVAGARIAATILSWQGFSRYVRRPTATMPSYSDRLMSDQELADVYAYIKSLPGPRPVKDIPLLNQLTNEK